MQEEEQAETFNQDQQEMFQNPDTNLGETRQRTPGTENVPVLPVGANQTREELPGEGRAETGKQGK
ncbi:MAG TPA: hypothetical protein VF656_02595 [Pyrinomonadaceae bacterium]|jgi:hypothetical protein